MLCFLYSDAPNLQWSIFVISDIVSTVTTFSEDIYGLESDDIDSEPKLCIKSVDLYQILVLLHAVVYLPIFSELDTTTNSCSTAVHGINATLHCILLQRHSLIKVVPM